MPLFPNRLAAFDAGLPFAGCLFHAWLPLAVGALLSSCGGKSAPAVPPPSLTVENNVLAVPPDSPLRERIRVGQAEEIPYQKQIIAPASLEANPTKIGQVTPPMVGRVVRLYVKLGDVVRAGQTLFTMDSPDMVESQKNYLVARSAYAQAELRLNRQKDLLEQKIAARKDYEEANTVYQMARSEQEQATSRLRLYGINPSRDPIGQPLPVKAPVSGRVENLNVTVGEYKNDMTEVLAVVADLQNVWITANLAEKDIQYVQQNLQAEATVNAYPNEKFKGRVFFVNDLLDETTHTVKVRMEFANPDLRLKPGMFGMVTFYATAAPAVVVPAKALVQDGGKNAVFVQVSPWKFQKRQVTAVENLPDHPDKVIITSGLTKGTAIVVEGALLLN